MPRLTLPLAAGGSFDSWDPRSAGQARLYWLGSPPDEILTPDFAQRLAASETLLHVITRAAPQANAGAVCWLIDSQGQLVKLFGAEEPLAIAVDPGTRVVAVLQAPSPDALAATADRMFASSTADVVRARAPVLLIDRVADEALCRSLIDYWNGRAKIENSVDAAGGNVVAADLKRRQDVQVDDPLLIARLQNALMRRVAPLIMQAFHTPISVMEAPLIGSYDAGSGGWFRRHRDNTTPTTANRQFAVSLNLNGDDDYAGGEVRFAEFGRELYRPSAGGALVFSCSLLHEVVPVTRGRRIGLFTFLSSRGRDPRLGQPARSAR